VRLEESLFTTVEDAIRILQNLQAQHPGVKLHLADETGGYESACIAVYYAREETDEEYELRMLKMKNAREQARRQQQEAEIRKRKLAEFNRLKRELRL
jgi:hypothetical protein